ncbi:response regulator transcription factor [Arcobacter lacus]|jgi:DNA-binding response OmpR family regulator|uniref:DNA-binding response regulator n=1 Tax=Arcobacter lacus TaxID=1912876 RepID=A0ABX5JL14_9BACT|nr:response regulator transcription factor [Arcobacter lacus]MCT7910051.1 response regulator transcription factor [Arcobacter lacus]MCT7912303.1 response regulator transcription factor [Arcobacter lacus]PUE66819.1 DNA-binding response regulator [Arcobacter lacus]
MNKNFGKLNVYTVLYVEDDLGIQNNIKEILEFYFKYVFVASNTKEAYKLYMENRPDLIITDIKMDDESGIDFIKKIRQNDTKTRVIITSAYTNTEYLLKATELFLIKYIVKPITHDKLNEALELFINSHKKEIIFSLKNDWTYDSAKSIVKNEKEEYILTKKESMFLKLLLSKNRVLRYEEIQRHISDGDVIISQNAMRLFIKNLRKKLPDDFLKNMQGIGYFCDTKNN